jgi:LAS superfamily LD-carboxypeptidase LdcB
LLSYAFSGCTNLETVKLSSNLQEIQYNLFENCSSLTTINTDNTLGTGVKSVYDYAFKNCTSLKTATLNNSGTIEGYVFSGCTALTRVNIGTGALVIDAWFDLYPSTKKSLPFEGCSNLEYINIEDFTSFNNIKGLKYLMDSQYGTKAAKTLLVKGVEHSSTSTLVIPEGITKINGVIIANKTFTVPEDYGYGITDDAMHAFDRMQTAAQNDGIDIFIKSDYRSYFDQTVIYKGYVKDHGKKEADRYSARPGHSEHQLGECVDINYTDESFADTPEGQWVDKNCSKYGYIIRYPDGKVNESMYIYEPWHLRYVGRKLAKKLYNGGDWITLEDHFGIDSNYNE